MAGGRSSSLRARTSAIALVVALGVLSPIAVPGAGAQTEPDPAAVPTEAATTPVATEAAMATGAISMAAFGTGLRPVDGPPIRLPSPLEPVASGDEGELVTNLQRRLTELGFWLGPVDGKYSGLTTQAVMAFQKYSDMERTGRADQATIDALGVASRPAARTLEGDIAEVDKRRQIIFLVRGGKVEWVFNTSTGTGKRYTEIGTSGKPVSGVAGTPDGRFNVNREIASGWRISELGQLWRPKYFNGGIAFHGAGSVPAYPASHGCVRLTVKAMDFVWDQDYLPRGMAVWVYSD